MAVQFALPMLILLLFAAITVIILFIKLCSKRPWIVVILVLALLLILAPVVYLRSARHVGHHWSEASTGLRQYRSDDVVTLETGLEGDLTGLRQIRSDVATTAIWQPGIEDEFEANVYPSKLSAVRSLGLHINEAVRRVFDAQTPPSRFILFQGAHDRSLIEEFGEAIARAFPGTQWTIKPETAAVQDDEVAVRLDLLNIQTHPAPWMRESENTVGGGTVQASVMAADRYASIKADFTDKPWVEDFSGFLNARPNRRFIIAKSTNSCLSEAEANHQALNNASAQVSDLLYRISRRQPGVPARHLALKANSDDILESNLVLDRFVQSFEGSAGQIWREALLIDGSTGKLEQLAHEKIVAVRAMKMSWARMFGSILGLIILITVVYAFLNAATKGYYVWSLRIAGIVLAVIVIVLLLV
jgi:hypothetical protein